MSSPAPPETAIAKIEEVPLNTLGVKPLKSFGAGGEDQKDGRTLNHLDFFLGM